MKTPMKAPVKKVKNSQWHIIVALQTIFMLVVIMWAITQKVEAEKQKVLALEAKEKSEIAQNKAEEAYNLALRTKSELMQEKEKAMIWQEKYQELLNQKK